MKTRIGLSVDRFGASVVVAVGSRIVWHREVIGGADAAGARPSIATLKDALADLPERYVKSSAIVVAIGPADAPIRSIAGVPESADDRAVRQIAQTNPSRFFLKGPEPLTVSSVQSRSGARWAAAADAALLQLLVEAARGAGLSVTSIVPAMAIQFRAFSEAVLEAVFYLDGNVLATAAYDAMGFVAMHRRYCDPSREAVPAAPDFLTEPLARLGFASARLRSAYAAAQAADVQPFEFEFEGRGRVEARSAILTAGIVCGLCLVCASVAPPLLAMRQRAAALHALTATAPAAARGAAALHRVASIANRYNAAEAFLANRHSVTLFLAELTHALPDSASLVSLRLDTDGGVAVVRAGDAMRVLGQFDALHDVSSVQSLGAVTSESVGNVPLERITVRFKWRTPAARAR